MKIFLVFFVKQKAWNWDINDDEFKAAALPTFAVTSKLQLKSH